jgi:hypothetical protein
MFAYVNRVFSLFRKYLIFKLHKKLIPQAAMNSKGSFAACATLAACGGCGSFLRAAEKPNIPGGQIPKNPGTNVPSQQAGTFVQSRTPYT